MSERAAVGFVGLGEMGYGMARNLVDKGHQVLAYDLNSRPVERLVQQGARAAASLAEIGRDCPVVMLMVVSGAQVEAVLAGPGGLLESMDGGVVMVHSTISLSELHRAAELAKAHGVTLIDCPVSGGKVGAQEGTLTMLCGGDLAAFDAHRELLDAVADNVIHLGPLGAGMVGKHANNLVIGVGRLAIGEAFAMAKKAGLSTEVLYRAMLTCSARSRQLEGLEGAIVRGEYPVRTFHGLKDLSAAVDSAAAVGQAMPVTELTRALYQLIDDKRGGLAGSDEVLRYFLDD